MTTPFYQLPIGTVFRLRSQGIFYVKRNHTVAEALSQKPGRKYRQFMECRFDFACITILGAN